MELAQLAPIDVRIIRALHENARSPMSKIAAQLGLPESTVRHRLNRLVERGMIEFAAMVNPLQLGYQIWAQLHLEVELSRIRSVAQQLARAPEVYFVGIATGGYDVLVGAVFKSNKELLDFITTSMSKVPGIRRTSTSSILEVVKRSMTFPLPDGIVAGHSGRRSPPRRRVGVEAPVVGTDGSQPTGVRRSQSSVPRRGSSPVRQ